MLGGGPILEIHELKAQGISIREISRRLGYSRNTVRKWLRARTPPQRKARAPQPSKLDPFKDYVRCRMAEGVYNTNKLYKEIKSQGYSGGKSILKSYVKPFRPPAKPSAVVRFDTLPGEQAQVDFGTFAYEDGLGRHRIYAFVMVLSWSRALYVEFVEKCDLVTLLRCHVHAFEAFGGVPRTILYDNLKAVVQGRNDSKVVWNAKFADFALLAGFIPRACRPYRAQTKGKVERAIGYVRQNFWVGLKFADPDDLNAQARAWCADTANQRIHSTTKARPCDLIASEGLLPMPDHRYMSMFVSRDRKVSRDGFVSFDGSRYGVPWLYAGKTVQVREIGHYVEIMVGSTRVALHSKAKPGSTVKLQDQWSGLLMDSPGPSRQCGIALLVPDPDVQVRGLSEYDQLCGGGRL